MQSRFVAFLLLLTMLCAGCAQGEEVGFATPEGALHAWLTALKEQDFARAASCFVTESLADNITEEVLTNGRNLPALSDGAQGVVLTPHKAYRDMNIANLKARAEAVTMHAAAALAVGPEEDFYIPSDAYNLYIYYYQKAMVERTLDLLRATDFQRLESLVILDNINAEEYLFEDGVEPEELAAEVSMIISAYGAQGARPVAAAFEVSTHGRCMVIMYALQYQDQWYLLGPSRLLVGTAIGVSGGTGIMLPD